MKKIIHIFIAATVLLMALPGCQKKAEAPVKTVDLRYRAGDSYDLPATGAQAFTILVASTDPWTVTSEHPDWCIISEEEGEASDPELVHTGKATPTTIRIQYYDNTSLDDRTDKIFIKSDYWTGKTITVNQKGIAFLTIPEADLDLAVEKAGGDYFIHIASNQPWSSEVTDGDWIEITDGATGEGDGLVTVSADINTMELRYAEVTVYDRHQEPVAQILFTQDGVQLVPASEEIRAGYDQLSGELEIVSNTKWTVSKASEGDDWFTIVNPAGEGDGKIQLTFTQNDEEGLRKAEILVKNVVDNPEDFQVEKTVVVKQAYRIEPVRVVVDNDELSLWKSDWANAHGFRLLHLPLEQLRHRPRTGRSARAPLVLLLRKRGDKGRYPSCGCQGKLRLQCGRRRQQTQCGCLHGHRRLDAAYGTHHQVRPQRRRTLPRHLPGERC